jgi:hypothetical protein
MKGIVDTSSLLNIARYYSPFDKNGRLKKRLEALFITSELIIIDKVLEQSSAIAKGIIEKEFPFIFDKKQSKLIINTSLVLPDTAFFNKLETDYCNQFIRKGQRIDDAEFENRKSDFIKDADAKMILYARKIIASNPIIITEESSKQNDNKLFKKIPSICAVEKITCCTVPEFFKQHCHFDLGNLLS